MKLRESKKYKDQELINKNFLKYSKRTSFLEDGDINHSPKMGPTHSKKTAVSRKSLKQAPNEPLQVGEIMHEAEQAGYQIIQHNPECDNFKISKRKKYQDYSINISQILDENENFYDFSHYANAMNQSLYPENHKKKNRIKKCAEDIKNNINHFKSMIYSFRDDLRIFIEEQSKIIRSILQQHKRIETKFKQKLKTGEQSCRVLRKENEIIKKQTKSLKAELEFIKQMAQKDKFITESLEKSLLGERDFDLGSSKNLLKKEIQELKKVNSQLKVTQASCNFKKSTRENTLDITQYQGVISEMKERYLKCIKNFSDEISSLELELLSIKERKLQNEIQMENIVNEKQKVIAELEQLVKQKQYENQILARNIESRIEEVLQVERKNRLKTEKQKLRETTRTRMYNNSPTQKYQNSQRKSISKNSEHGWRRPQNIYEKNSPYFSPDHLRGDYFQSETPRKTPKLRETLKSEKEHFNFKNRIQQIEEDAKKELNKIIGRIN